MNTIHITQHNVRAWTYYRRQELSQYYTTHAPDIILLNSIGKNTVKIFNYNTHSRNDTNEDNAGIAICIKHSIKYRLLDDFDQEMLAIEVYTNKGPIIIATLYIPPRRPTIPSQDILKITQKPQPTYIIGDLNAKHRTLKHRYDNQIGKTLNHLITQDHLTFLGPDFDTCISSNGTGNPDMIFTNRHHHLAYRVYPGEITSSDHIPLNLTLSTTAILTPTRPRLLYKQADWKKFKTLLETTTTEYKEKEKQCTQDKDTHYIDNKINQLYNLILTATTQCIPTTTYKRLPTPRTSKHLKYLTWQAETLKNKATRENNWTPHTIQTLKQIQREILTESRRNYVDNWNNIISNIKFNPKKPQDFWNTIKRLTGSNSITPTYIVQNNTKLHDDQEIETAFRLQWQDIFRITPEENIHFDTNHETQILTHLSLHREQTQTYAAIDTNRLDADNYMTRPIHIEDVKTIIKHIKNKAPGQSGITKTTLQHTPDTTLQLLTDIYNETLSIGYFPQHFKQSTIIFIPKQGKDKTQVKNYRPISLLEIPGKILERLITNRINTHLHEHDMINPNQHGFTTGKGTHTALAHIYEIIAQTQRHRQGCNLVSRDVSKAFDKVWHEGLKYKILNANMPDIITKFTCSFLDNRRANIRINTYTGPQFPLLSGVPQGSILSPTLYNYYTHDIPPPSQGTYTIQYADDLTQIITYPTTSKNMLAKKTETEINRINTYEKQWKIATNTDKFQLLSITARQPTQIKINNNIIPFRPQTRILGVTFGSRGTRQHIKNRVALTNNTLKTLRRFRGLNTKTQLQLYKTLARPQLEYPPIILTTSSHTNIKNMQALQNKALRKAYKHKPPYLSTTKFLHEHSKLEEINDRITRLSSKTWNQLHTITETPPPVILGRGTQDHPWWPRIATVMERIQDPTPTATSS